MRLHLQKWFFISEAARLNWLTLNKLDRTAVPAKRRGLVLVDFTLVFLSLFPSGYRFSDLPSLSPSSASSTGSFLHSALSCSPPPAGVSLISRLSIYFCVLLGAGFVLRCLRLTRMERAILTRVIMERGGREKLRGVVNLQREPRESRIYGKPTKIFPSEVQNWTFAEIVVKEPFRLTMMTKSWDSVINIWSSQPARNAMWRLIKNSLLIISIDLSTWLGRD